MTILKQYQINWFRQKTNCYRRKTASQTETKCNLVQRPKRSPWLLQKNRIFYKGVNSNGIFTERRIQLESGINQRNVTERKNKICQNQKKSRLSSLILDCLEREQ